MMMNILDFLLIAIMGAISLLAITSTVVLIKLLPGLINKLKK